MAKLDVMLIHPLVNYKVSPTLIKHDSYLNHPPLGILYLHSCLKEAGIKSKTYDMMTQLDTLEKIIKEIEKTKTKIVGISALTCQIRGAVQLAKAIKKHFGNKVTTVLGGIHITADPGIMDKHKCFDIGIMGEAEITFTQVVKDILKGKKVKRVIEATPPDDLDALPLLDLDSIDFSLYPDYLMNNIEASRGCPYRCVFCTNSNIRKKIRFKSPKRVVEEIEYIKSKTNNNPVFTFVDDTLTLHRDRIIEICNLIKEHNLNIEFSAMTRVNVVDDELLHNLKNAGCNRLMFGIESGNERVREQVVGKKITEEQVKNAFSLCNKYGILVDVFLMMGFPTETVEEMKDTCNFPFKYNINEFGIHLTVPLPGSLLWKNSIANGDIPGTLVEDYIEGNLGPGFRDSWPRFIPQGVTREQMDKLIKDTYMRYYFSSRYLMKKGLYTLKNFNIRQFKSDLRSALSIAKSGYSAWGK